jgi:hypothetical protein
LWFSGVLGIICLASFIGVLYYLGLAIPTHKISYF